MVICLSVLLRHFQGLLLSYGNWDGIPHPPAQPTTLNWISKREWMDRKKHGGKILRFLFVCFVLEQNLFDEALIEMFIFIFFTLFLKIFFNLWCFIIFLMCSYFFKLTLVLLEFLFVTSQTTLIYFSIISIMEELVVPFSSFPTTLSFLWK